MEIRNNIHRFPRNDDQRFEDAVELFKDGECELAIEEATALIDQGYDHANTLLGAIYERGCAEFNPDYEKARFYYQMAVDAVGSAEAWLALGRLNYLGRGILPDYQKSFYYYSVVDEDSDNAVASFMLGRMYFEGKGVTRDIENAKRFFSKAANLGSVFALTYLGRIAWEQRRILASLWLRSKAAALAFLITLRNPKSSRLRRI